MAVRNLRRAARHELEALRAGRRPLVRRARAGREGPRQAHPGAWWPRSTSCWPTKSRSSSRSEGAGPEDPGRSRKATWTTETRTDAGGASVRPPSRCTERVRIIGAEPAGRGRPSPDETEARPRRRPTAAACPDRRRRSRRAALDRAGRPARLPSRCSPDEPDGPSATVEATRRRTRHEPDRPRRRAPTRRRRVADGGDPIRAVDVLGRRRARPAGVPDMPTLDRSADRAEPRVPRPPQRRRPAPSRDGRRPATPGPARREHDETGTTAVSTLRCRRPGPVGRGRAHVEDADPGFDDRRPRSPTTDSAWAERGPGCRRPNAGRRPPTTSRLPTSGPAPPGTRVRDRGAERAGREPGRAPPHRDGPPSGASASISSSPLRGPARAAAGAVRRRPSPGAALRRRSAGPARCRPDDGAPPGATCPSPSPPGLGLRAGGPALPSSSGTVASLVLATVVVVTCAAGECLRRPAAGRLPPGHPARAGRHGLPDGGGLHQGRRRPPAGPRPVW